MARYDSLRKLSRNRALFDFQAAHPDLSWREISEVFGVSPQRVGVILAEERRRREWVVEREKRVAPAWQKIT